MDKYTEYEVLDIIKSCTKESPEEVLLKWNIKKADTPLDLNEWNFPYFVYTFPLIIMEEEVAKITLVKDFSRTDIHNFILKYLGAEDFDKTVYSFSHDTYHWCYLTINKGFVLPKIVEGFYAGTFKAVDASGKEFDFRISFGYANTDEDLDKISEYTEDWNGYSTYWLDYHGVHIQIRGLENGWSLGEKINENIQNRLGQNKYE